MNQKKKQSIVAVVATVLTVTCVMSPVASVYATETDTTTITQQNEATETNLNQKNTDVPINASTFPDGTFREYVKINFDTTKNDKLTTDEIANVKIIRVAGNPAIKDLKGIEHFTALTTLYCSYTGIQDLDVSGNPALTYLYCSDTGITSLDVSGNPDLIHLYCSNTGIQDLDVSGNPDLTHLYCNETGIGELDVSKNPKLTILNCYFNANLKELTVKGATALTELNCYSTKITSLDVSSNPVLTKLYCNNTNITSLDVSKNPDLEYLYCFSTKITSLDVSSNEALTNLYCYNTGITSLDVSKNPKLTTLDCDNTGITSLDVSNNTNLQWLYCSYTPLAYLNLGTNSNLSYLFMNDLQPVEIELTVDNTFNIQDIFPGILIDKIKIESGANYDIATGVMSEYTLGKTITYEYDCGAANNNPTTIKVSLLPMGKSTISITDNLNKTYDGTAVSPEVKKEGSSGAVSYKWERKKNANDWEDIASAPIDAGTYRVTAIVADDIDYKGATSEPKEFTISQATNDWTDTLSIKDWTYNETANNPTATAKFGTVDYLYSGSENGKFTSDKPTKAGTWYVKASVAGTENYTGMETILDFTIAPKSIDNNSSIIISDINSDKDVENLIIKDGDKELGKGTDYDVDKKQNDNEVIVTITFKGNYTGTITKTYTVNVDKPKDSVSVSTGDTTHTGLLAMITLLSASCIVFLTEKKRRKEF